jgi:hypothetical protein
MYGDPSETFNSSLPIPAGTEPDLAGPLNIEQWRQPLRIFRFQTTPAAGKFLRHFTAIVSSIKGASRMSWNDDTQESDDTP